MHPGTIVLTLAAVSNFAFCLPVGGPSGKAPDASQEDAIVPRTWLVIDPVDGRGRRPFRPDAVLSAHLLDPGAPVPVEGESLSGESGEGTWSLVEANEKGRVGGRHGYAYTRVESPERRVVLARLAGASTLLVNGRAIGGDIYSYGYGGLPCLLEEGANEVFVNGIRGGFGLTFEPVEPGLLFGSSGFTLPDLVVGEAAGGELGLTVMNATDDWIPRVEVEVRGAEMFLRSKAVLEEGLAPLAVRTVALRLAASDPDFRLAEAGEVELELRLSGHGEVRSRAIKLRVREPRALRKRTYRSSVDGSVQEFAVLPPSEGEHEGPPRLLLSLHGAGVYAPNQAGSYGAKPDFWHVAPTNRSKFGFDWQDWGRIDAYDALEQALRESGVARRHVYLSGHSMGGHGAWHLAANDLDGFAAVAPSAAWQSFDTYGGRPDGELKELWHRADAPSRTVDLVPNLRQLPTFILHGEADDNVRAKEGQDMHALLVEAGASPTLHVEPGKGHWWDGPAGAGADCLDWPGFFELFRSTEIPIDPPMIDFTTVDPGTDSTHHWVRVIQVVEPGRPARVMGELDTQNDSVMLATENIRRLELLGPAAGVAEVEIDVRELRYEAGASLLLDSGHREGEGTYPSWQVAPPAGAKEKTPERMGPMKRGIDRRFVLVVPTGGSEEENDAALARATFDAGTWWYRGNGDAPIVRDKEWLAHAARYRGRNAVLYGNADTNQAWEAAVPESCPVKVGRGSAQLGGDRFEGDALDALFVYPRRGEDETLVIGLGATGPAADRRAIIQALFVSGVGYPDYAIVGPEVLTEGDGGIRAAGFFGPDWQLP